MTISLSKRYGFESLRKSDPNVFDFAILRCDVSEVDGDALLDRDFLKFDPLIRADILTDCIGLLKRALDEAVSELCQEKIE